MDREAREALMLAVACIVVVLTIGFGVEMLGGNHHLQPGLGRMLAPQTDAGWRNLESKTSYWSSCNYDSPERTNEQ